MEFYFAILIMSIDSIHPQKPSFPSGPSLITDILLFKRFVFPAHQRSRTHSPPGHLLHLLHEGDLELRIGNHDFHAGAGDVIYYYESEEVVWHGNPQPVCFDSLAFLAPQLQPLHATRRVFRSSPEIRIAFKALHELWTGHEQPALLTMTHAHALSIAASLIVHQNMCAGEARPVGNPWWDVEAYLRRHSAYHSTIAELSERFHLSPATLARCCHSATGLPPAKRIRSLRMHVAEGLLRYSMLTVSEVADQLGYGRIHEFSREFSATMGQSPRQWRAGMVALNQNQLE
jgi:AraC-like DNA-binding protein